MNWLRSLALTVAYALSWKLADAPEPTAPQPKTAPPPPAPKPIAPKPAPKPLPPTPAEQRAASDSVRATVNAWRSGLHPGSPLLTSDERLIAAAMVQARNCAAAGKATHDAPDGSDEATRVSRAGYAWSAVAEVAAETLPFDNGPGAATAEWWQSAPHKADLIDPRYTQFGCAYADGADGRRYYVGCLARPA